ncbi:hypothetical protein [Nonomuraea roseoviolacea]|uniref:hypothetical protein n=1 Tax=Nonomuraea roseoviolacea TaxID=103837 RepID=UPI0031DD1B8C
MAAVYRFTIDQGATFRRVLRWTSGGEPLNLTGFSARMEIRTKTGGELLYRLDTSTGGITLGGVEGTIQLHIPASASTAWAWRTGVYDLELIGPTGDVVRLIQGGVQVSPEVTTGD